MIRTSFNDDWRVRPKVSHFLELLGGGVDALGGGDAPARRHDRRDRATPAATGAPGSSPAACGSTRRPSSRPSRVARQARPARVRGRVPRRASVWVNGALAGHRPYGYTDFAVSIGEHLRFGEENVVTVDATAHDDARWYSGAGIYRPVHLVVGEPVHLALDAVHVTTPTVDDRRSGRGGDRDRERVARHDVDHRHDRAASTTREPSSRATSPRSRCSPAGPRRSASACSSSTRSGGASTRPNLYTCRTLLEAEGAVHRPTSRPRSASAPSTSTRCGDCASTASRSSSAVPASTTTTASSAPPRSRAPTSGGSSA